MDTPWQQTSKEASFLCSTLTVENPFQTHDEFLAWFQSRRTATRFVVEQIPLAEMDQWTFAKNPHRLVHRSGKFFAIEGVRAHTNYGPVPEWDQPIINQPEIGILGIITKVFNGTRYFLMQAKMEPGNVNALQLSPTVQATKSNYTQVHRGKLPPYLAYFLDHDKARILVDQLQSEQGARFLRKRNRNMIIEIAEDVPPHDEFRWLTLGQIKQLLTVDNLVNMDARTVLSCIPFTNIAWKHYYAATSQDYPDHFDVFGRRLTGFAKDLFLSLLDRRPVRHTLDEIISWFTRLKTRYELEVRRIPLDKVRRWEQTEYEIRHETGRHFSVIAVSVQAGNREVTHWTQPLLKHTDYGVVGFLTKKFDGTLHFLVRASLEPGNLDIIEMGPTVACSNAEARAKQPNHPPFLETFLQAPPEQVRYSAIQSEEGGRFYHFQNRYMILELPPDTQLDPPEHFIWMTLGQIIDFTKYSYFNIEARNLLACLNPLEDRE
ncbi:MAG: NDP-hexose 2,3-dehydratase family protein [Anaerolineae bacterium]|nr:NDP-hexose 2,3-dehydratase family protein [Anaerolineae bacterium]